MAEQDHNITQDETAEGPAALRPTAGRWVLIVSLAAVMLIALMWWSGRTAPAPLEPGDEDLDPTRAPVAEVQRQAPVVQPAATPPPAMPEPTPTPVVTQEVTGIALPTVTPTLVPSDVPSRAVTFGGMATLRLALQNDSFASTGRPVDREIEPREFVLDGTSPAVTDNWCMQLGIANLLFDVTFTLNPLNGTVDTTGTLALHDGFCDAPGPRRASTALNLEVPADASAEVVQSLQTERHLLEVTDLLDIDTGVFVELVISNTRPE